MPRTYQPVVPVTRPCACGCGEPITTGRADKLYVSAYHSLRHHKRLAREKQYREGIIKAYNTALFRQHWNMNFEQFCAIIDEPTERDGEPNVYAVEKWAMFKDLIQLAIKLGTQLEAIVDAGMQDERRVNR